MQDELGRRLPFASPADTRLLPALTPHGATLSLSRWSRSPTRPPLAGEVPTRELRKELAAKDEATIEELGRAWARAGLS